MSRRIGREVCHVWPAVVKREAAKEWTMFDEQLKAEFRERPARSVAEAGERIKTRTGWERRPTQVRHHLHRLGLESRRMRAIPAPPKKS